MSSKKKLKPKKPGKQRKNKENKVTNKVLTIFGANANGILGKKDSLISNIHQLQPAVIFIQESKVSRKGQLKIQNYDIFEVIRPNCPTGGSILTGIHKNLSPVYISGGEDSIELLVVQAKVGSANIRFINGYGPQENCKVEERISFYARLEQEVVNAKLFDNMVCIEMDANAKVGNEMIKLDPCSRSSNGTLLVELCERNNLIICNATQLCQ